MVRGDGEATRLYLHTLCIVLNNNNNDEVVLARRALFLRFQNG